MRIVCLAKNKASQSESGGAIVESAIVVPLIVILCAGVLNLSVLLYDVYIFGPYMMGLASYNVAEGRSLDYLWDSMSKELYDQSYRIIDVVPTFSEPAANRLLIELNITFKPIIIWHDNINITTKAYLYNP